MTNITHLIPSLDTPQALNERRIGKALRVVARGRADGANNSPAPEANQPNELELSIITVAQQAIDQFSQWLKRRLKEIAKKVSELAPTENEKDYEAPVEEARFDIAKLRDERREDLAAAFEATQLSARELRHFKREHGLTHRSASYHPTVFSIGAALLVLAAESAANFQLFAEASDFGALGGVSYAISFSLANLVLGYVVMGAIGLRFIGHVRILKRIAGMFATIAGAGAAVVYNAYVAVYRGLLEANPDGVATARIWDRMVADPTGFLNDDHGLLLFLIGLGSVLAFCLEGYLLFSDRYPGYKPMDVAHKDAEDAFDAEMRAFRAAAEKIVVAKLGVIDTRLASALDRTRKAIDLINQAEIEVQTAEQAALESRNVAQRLIAAYRSENAAVRDAPSPHYFRSLPEIGAELRGLEPMDLAEQRNHRLAEASQLRQHANAAKETLRAIALEALEQIKADSIKAQTEGVRRATEAATFDDIDPGVVSFPGRRAE